MLPSINLPIGAPKRQTDDQQKPFDVEFWVNRFKQIQYVKNYDDTMNTRQEYSGSDLYKVMEERGIDNMYWLGFSRDYAEFLDIKKMAIYEMFRKLVENPASPNYEILKKIIEVHNEIAEDMESMGKDPSYKLWFLMKSAIRAVLDSYPEFRRLYVWDQGDVERAITGSGIDQHGYFRMITPVNKKKKRRL